MNRDFRDYCGLTSEELWEKLLTDQSIQQKEGK
jgi:hypothetical protein